MRRFQGSRLLTRCGLVPAVVLTAFVSHSVHHIEPSVVALPGAGVLVVISYSTSWPDRTR